MQFFLVFWSTVIKVLRHIKESNRGPNNTNLQNTYSLKQQVYDIAGGVHYCINDCTFRWTHSPGWNTIFFFSLFYLPEGLERSVWLVIWINWTTEWKPIGKFDFWYHQYVKVKHFVLLDVESYALMTTVLCRCDHLDIYI